MISHLETDTKPKDRPILFSGPMVRAILDGTKVQTRRIVKLTDSGRVALGGRRGRNWHIDDPDAVLACPHGQPGDRLWVRESFLPDPPIDGSWSGDAEWNGCGRPISGVPTHYRSPAHVIYAASWDGPDLAWRPSLHMPRWASRITLELTDVRVQRLQEITEEDAIAEGFTQRGYWWNVGANWEGDGLAETARGAFEWVWDALNAKRGYGWDANPWVWALTFKRLEAPSHV